MIHTSSDKFKTYNFRGIPKEKSISIRTGNRKIGSTPNTSFPPVETCPPDIKCAKGCYMRKFLKIYPSISRAYAKNYRIYRESPERYWEQVSMFLEDVKPKFFRYMVAGDLPDLNYARKVLVVARKNPETNFLAFTKQFEFLQDNSLAFLRPKNLQLIASGWPGVEIPEKIRKNYRVAWCQDGSEKRIPKNAFLCEDACEPCRHCYVDFDEDIILPFH